MDDLARNSGGGDFRTPRARTNTLRLGLVRHSLVPDSNSESVKPLSGRGDSPPTAESQSETAAYSISATPALCF